jgi:hypothetical protein
MEQVMIGNQVIAPASPWLSPEAAGWPAWGQTGWRLAWLMLAIPWGKLWATVSSFAEHRGNNVVGSALGIQGDIPVSYEGL